jgi:hypothetical protein
VQPPGRLEIAIERFDFSTRFRGEAWWTKRPIPHEWQESWLLAKLREGVARPASMPECNDLCPLFDHVVESLWKFGDLRDGTLELTD